MRTYDTYKDSGISWLGQIPSHWESRKFKFTFSERKQKGFPDEPLLAATQSHGVIPKDLYETRTMVATKGLETLKLVEKGDFVISLRSFQGGIEYAYYRGIISPAYTVLTPTAISANYFKYLGKCQSFIALLKSSVTGIREGQNIDYSKLRENLLPLPPVNEQDTIAAYLDSATAEIDKAIASQQRMVELLQERKQIIINQAVTQGLNPDAPMKPTNIDWLPQIPAHWQLKKIKYVVLLKSGQNLTSEQIEKEDLYPVYGGNGLRGYYSDFNNDGDYVLIGRQGALCGNINYAHNKFWATEHAVVCYPVDKVNALWLGETLRAMNLNRYATASAQPGLAVENIKGLMMPIPDYNEQNGIAVFIEKQTKPIDESIESCNRMIGALTERKQILINDVVTGKIKVS